MRMERISNNKLFIESLDKFLKSFDNLTYGPDTIASYGSGWDDCQRNVLEILKKEYNGNDNIESLSDLIAQKTREIESL